MKGSTARRQEREHSWFRPMLHRQLGLSADNHIGVLKQHVTDAGLMPADGKLELVVIESLEHYEELLQGGVPMARIDAVADSPPSGRYVTVRRRWWYLAIAGTLLMPPPWAWYHWAHQLL